MAPESEVPFKREFKRYACGNWALVTDLDTKEVRKAFVLNISPKGIGLSFKYDETFQPNRILVEIQDGKGLEGLAFKGEVRSKQKVTTFLIAGAQLESVSRLTMMKIKDYISSAKEYVDLSQFWDE